jgi:hypothetical protein
MPPKHPETVTVSRDDLVTALACVIEAGSETRLALLRLRDAADVALHHTPAGGGNLHGTYIGDSQDPDCFCIYQDREDSDRDVVHICDWPALRAAIEQHQSERRPFLEPGARDSLTEDDRRIGGSLMIRLDWLKGQMLDMGAKFILPFGVMPDITSIYGVPVMRAEVGRPMVAIPGA